MLIILFFVFYTKTAFSFEFVIDPKFSNASSFSEGLAAVAINENNETKWGFIDKDGSLKIAYQFNSGVDGFFSIEYRFKDGLSRVLVGGPKGKWGFIDKSGIFKINPKFDFVEDFNNGLAVARIGDIQGGRYGFIDLSGKFKISPQFSRAGSFHEGIARVSSGSSAVQFIKEDGQKLTSQIYESAHNFSSGYATVGTFENNNYVAGYMNIRGEEIIEKQFSAANDFSEGLAGVAIGELDNRKWGFINDLGKFVINPQFDPDNPDDLFYFGSGAENSYYFSNGRSVAILGKDKNRKYGFIDKLGHYVVQPKYQHAMSFKNGFARVWTGSESNRRCGYINTDGVEVIPLKFEACEDFSEGIAAVEIDGKFGFIKP
jgi:hypothetical protein